MGSSSTGALVAANSLQPLSTKQTDTIENVSAAPRGRGGASTGDEGGRHIRPLKLQEILGYDFQDMVFRTWDLNFRAWIFTLAVSKTET